MKAENSITNKIMPVKSIVQSTKFNNKKNSSQFANSEYNNVPLDHFSIPKHLQPYSYMPNQSYSHYQSNTPQQFHHHKEKIKGISVGSKNYTLMKSSQEVGQNNETPQKSYKQFQEYPNSSKKQLYRHSRHESDITKNINFLSEGTIKQVAVDRTPRKIDIVPYDQKLSYRGLINEKKEFFKSVTLNRTDEKDMNYFGQKILSKIDDQTWNVSKFEKFMSNQRESQPIYKDQLTKTKTELFQKEALLFEATQKIEENQRSIKELKCKLEIQIELNRNLKSRLSNQTNVKQECNSNFGLIHQVQKLNAQIMRLKNELNRNKQQKVKQQMDSFASSKLIQLKLKQFQLQERERTQYIIELKQKEKKMIEGYEKMLNGQQELLRQKEQQLTQISLAAQFYKEQFTKISKIMEQSKDIDKNAQVSKQMVIRQLSGEIGDLKQSLKNMEFRMRQLIQNEEQFKKQIQSKEAEIKILHQEKTSYLGKISQLEEKLISKLTQLQNNTNLKQMEVSMMTKTCEEYKRKLDQYYKYSEQMRLSLLNYNQIQNQLKKVLIEKQRQIQVLKNVIEPSDKSGSPRKQMSPIKQGRADDKEYNRLKSINFKLIKENEKLNTIVKDLDFKIYQLYKVNEGLNETILTQSLKNLNEEMKRKYGKVQDQAAFL